MPRFLYTVSYTAEGARGLAKEGASSRRAQIEQLCEQVGGKLESMYYALGKADAYAIVELSDATVAASVSLRINASGAVNVSATPLLTVEEMDLATQKQINYRPPGS